MDISVIVATYNRAGILKGTLENLAALRPQGVTHEIIVVDNNSSDNTRAVVEEFAQRAPIRYLFEERQGKSYALNTAIEVAQGELFVFTDDDVFVPADWLDRYWAAAQAHPEADVFGGSVVARLPASAPQWAHHSRADFGQLDLGNDARSLSSGEYYLGANTAVRASALKSGVQFAPDGVPQRELEDIAIQVALEKRGCRRVSIGGEPVIHRIDAHPWMFSRAYQFRRVYHTARGMVRLGLAWTGTRRIAGVPVARLYYATKALLRCVAVRVTFRSVDVRFGADMELAHHLGVLHETILACRRRGGATDGK